LAAAAAASTRAASGRVACRCPVQQPCPGATGDRCSTISRAPPGRSSPCMRLRPAIGAVLVA